MKNKKIFLLILIVFLITLTTTLLYDTVDIPKSVDDYNIEVKEEKNIVKELQTKYNNNEIVAFLEIPNVLSVPIAKTNNNDFYLNHDLYKKEEKKGSVFMDYRNTLNDKKILIYGHSSTYRKVIFSDLEKYNDESYLKKHPSFYLYTEDGKYKYNIFSSYIENNDFDYVNLKDFHGLTWNEHLQKLKNKTLVKTNIVVNKNSKIVILQTCSFNESYKGEMKYQLVLGALEK